MMAFDHNSWATLRLLEACRGLNDQQLGATLPGAYGNIPATFWHLVNSEGRYHFHLTEIAPDWTWTGQDTLTLDQLEACAEQMADRWRRYFATSPDEGRKLIRRTLSGLVFDVEAGVIHAQVLNHGNVHREQICAILTSLDFEPPDISGWGFGESTGRLVDIGPAPDEKG